MLSYPHLPNSHTHTHTHRQTDKHTHTQTDGDYTKRVVTTLRDHTLENVVCFPDMADFPGVAEILSDFSRLTSIGSVRISTVRKRNSPDISKVTAQKSSTALLMINTRTSIVACPP